MTATRTAPTGRSTEPAPPDAPRRLGFAGRMMAPGVVLLALLSVLPFLALVVMSLTRVHLLGGVRLEWVGLTNWIRLFTDADMWASWARLGVYLVLTLGLELVLGMLIAFGLHRVLRGRGLLLSLLLLPMFAAPVIVGLLGRYLTDSTFGLYTWIFGQVGLHIDPLGGTTSAFVAVVLMDVWEWTPLVALITLAGLSAVNESVLEAAELDGATGWARFRHVILPSISTVLLVALLIRAMDAVRYFDIISITTNGGPADATKIVPVRLYETAFRFFDLGYAAAIGLLLLVLTIVIARIFVRVLNRKGLAG
ncbi:MAG: sugar ABC transporter permease [Actinocatenispora sp.]